MKVFAVTFKQTKKKIIFAEKPPPKRLSRTQITFYIVREQRRKKSMCFILLH